MRLLWLFVSVAVTVAVTEGQGQAPKGQGQAPTGQGQAPTGQTQQTGNEAQKGQTGQTSNQGQQGQTGQTSNQGQQGQGEQTGQQQPPGKGQGGGGKQKCTDNKPKKFCTHMDDNGECYTVASANMCRKTCKLCDLECRDLKHWMKCEDMERKGKCGVSVVSNLCRKTCNLCDCADKQSTKFCSKVKTDRKCKNWGLAQNCKRSCNLCGRSAPRNDTQYQCEISGDPHLKEFDGDSASLPYPCLYRVADLLINISSTTPFSFLGIEVHAASSMETYKHRFYVSQVEVYLTVYDGTIDKLVKAHSGYFKTNEDKLNAFLQHPTGYSWQVGGESIAIEMAEVGYDFESSQAFLEIYEGSPSILFRPVNRQEGVPQSMRPGLYIEVGDDVIKQETVEFPYSLCSNTDDTRSMTTLASNRKFNKRQLLLHTVLNHNLKQSDTQCALAVSTYQQCAMGKHSALTKCQPYLERIAVGCLLDQKMKPFDAFLLCLQHMCGSATANAAVDLSNVRNKMTARCQAHVPDVME